MNVFMKQKRADFFATKLSKINETLGGKSTEDTPENGGEKPGAIIQEARGGEVWGKHRATGKRGLYDTMPQMRKERGEGQSGKKEVYLL